MLIKAHTPETAVDALIALHLESTKALKTCLDRYFATQEPPTPSERRLFCYPELIVHYEAQGVQPSIPRAYAKFQGPGTYITTVTQPAHFRRYLEEQLRYLVRDYGASIEVARSEQEIPYPYVLEKGDDLGRDGMTAAELAVHFPGAAPRAGGRRDRRRRVGPSAGPGLSAGPLRRRPRRLLAEAAPALHGHRLERRCSPGSC